jgi:putative membrane protein
MLAPILSSLLLADAWGMHDGDIGTGWMIVTMLGMILFWGLVVLGIVWLLRESVGRRHQGPAADPLSILDRRLAEGELTVSEYEERRKTLAGSQ